MCGRDADDVDESAAVVDDEAAYAVAAGVDVYDADSTCLVHHMSAPTGYLHVFRVHATHVGDACAAVSAAVDGADVSDFVGYIAHMFYIHLANHHLRICSRLVYSLWPLLSSATN